MRSTIKRLSEVGVAIFFLPALSACGLSLEETPPPEDQAPYDASAGYCSEEIAFSASIASTTAALVVGLPFTLQITGSGNCWVACLSDITECEPSDAALTVASTTCDGCEIVSRSIANNVVDIVVIPKSSKGTFLATVSDQSGDDVLVSYSIVASTSREVDGMSKVAHAN